jgi:hypothetical protein
MRMQAMSRLLPPSIALTAVIASGFILAQSVGNTVLGPADLGKLFPATVYYLGQTAPAQLRNSGGVKFADGHFVLASLVDTSGYSTGVAAKYQGYLITEVPLKIEGQTLAAGAYGFGFLDGGRFLVTDLGGHNVISANSTADTVMKRPRPLQVIADAAGGYRLYFGRTYVRFDR